MTLSGTKLKLAIAAGTLLILLFDYHYYSNWWASQKTGPAVSGPTTPRYTAQLEDLRLHGTELPGCPLIFPLLDSKDQVTPLGSYLSYFGMSQAAFLPQAALSLPDLDKAFGDFDLFNPDRIASDSYKAQLPFRFTSKDYGEGTWKKTFTGWKIHLRFWGTKPEKTYDHVFAKGDLHSAPSWIAASLQNYLSFTPTADQSAYRSQSVFTNDDDFIRAANLESFFQNGGAALVTHWEDILAKNPDRPELAVRWTKILDARDGQPHPEILEALSKKNPSNAQTSRQLASEYAMADRYPNALLILFSELKTNDNSAPLYEKTTYCLRSLDATNEALQLNQNWTRKYQNNPEACLGFAQYCLHPSPNVVQVSQTSPNTPTPAASSVVPPISHQGLLAAQKFVQMSPEDSRGWSLLINYAVEAGINRAQVDSDFQKSIQINPGDNKAYASYLTYLLSQGEVDAQDALDFAKKYAPQHPFLFYQQAMYEFSAENPTPNSESFKNFKREAALELSYQADLKSHPANLPIWNEYLEWIQLAGTTSKALAFAQTLTVDHSELKALPPTLVLMTYDKPGADAKAVSQMSGAYQSLLALDDQDWNRWNSYAKFCVEHHLDAEAKKAVTAIGDNWDEEVWPRADFDKARVNLGLDPIPPEPVTSPDAAVTPLNTPTMTATATEVPVPATPSPTTRIIPTPLITPSPVESPATITSPAVTAAETPQPTNSPLVVASPKISEEITPGITTTAVKTTLAATTTPETTPKP